ncbi:hypothetical protein [Ottowia oryzae]
MTYSAALLRQATWRKWQALFSWRYALAVLLMGGAGAYLWLKGERGWTIGVLGLALGLALVMPVVVWLQLWRAAQNALRALGTTASATLVADEAGLQITSAAGSAALPWPRITELRPYPQFWLMQTDDTAWATLPTGGLSAQARQYIADQASAHGAKVRRG